MTVTDDFSAFAGGADRSFPDYDPEETTEWLESLDSLVRDRGTGRAQFIVRSLLQRAGAKSVGVP
ncbi:hypothetical protein ACFQ36_21195, partial [Arthrobacter sp. GCM10027362]|uniref:hypothetical protein n=1 Tax=Arthrobacter sp. GCM10027362 TaxID=3273379 RepID=UPI00363253A7